MKNCRNPHCRPSGGICEDSSCRYWLPIDRMCDQCAARICRHHEPISDEHQLRLDLFADEQEL